MDLQTTNIWLAIIAITSVLQIVMMLAVAYYVTQVARRAQQTIDTVAAVTSRVYIQTGMLNDTQPEAKLVASLLRKKGGTVRYEEYPEGHNWKNWGSHLPKILQYFFPM